MLYASDYGFSDRLSQTIARGITKANVAVEMLDLLSADPQVHHSYPQVPIAPGLLCMYGHPSGLSIDTSPCASTERDTVVI